MAETPVDSLGNDPSGFSLRRIFEPFVSSPSRLTVRRSTAEHFERLISWPIQSWNAILMKWMWRWKRVIIWSALKEWSTANGKQVNQTWIWAGNLFSLDLCTIPTSFFCVKAHCNSQVHLELNSGRLIVRTSETFSTELCESCLSAQAEASYGTGMSFSSIAWHSHSERMLLGVATNSIHIVFELVRNAMNSLLSNVTSPSLSMDMVLEQSAATTIATCSSLVEQERKSIIDMHYWNHLRNISSAMFFDRYQRWTVSEVHVPSSITMRVAHADKRVEWREIATSVSGDFRQRTSELLKSYDEQSENNLRVKDGTILSENATLQDIHHDFGITGRPIQPLLYFIPNQINPLLSFVRQNRPFTANLTHLTAVEHLVYRQAYGISNTTKWSTAQQTCYYHSILTNALHFAKTPFLAGNAVLSIRQNLPNSLPMHWASDTSIKPKVSARSAYSSDRVALNAWRLPSDTSFHSILGSFSMESSTWVPKWATLPTIEHPNTRFTPSCHYLSRKRRLVCEVTILSAHSSPRFSFSNRKELAYIYPTPSVLLNISSLYYRLLLWIKLKSTFKDRRRIASKKHAHPTQPRISLGTERNS